jgi:amino acid adenylation domain-containing protein
MTISRADTSPEERRTLLRALLESRTTDAARRRLPASYGQEAMWFEQQRAPHSSAYAVPVALRLRASEAPIEVETIRTAVEGLLVRHPVLSARFDQTGDGLAQEIDPQRRIDVQVLQGARWSEEETAQRIAELAAHPFQLDREPPARAYLIERTPHDCTLLLVFHHIVIDMWSATILFEEFRALYTAARAGVLPDLPPAPQYDEFVAWQRAAMQSARGDELWEYWRRALGEDVEPLHLPFARPRPAAPTSRAATEILTLDGRLVERLRAFNAEHGLTMFTTLLGALQILFHRFTGQQCIGIGSPALGRTQERWLRTVGYFVNLVPMLARFEGNPSALDFLRAAQRSTLATLDHQDWPFSLLMERLYAAHHPGSTPFTQVLFGFDRLVSAELHAVNGAIPDGTGTGLRIGDLTMEAIAVEQRSVQADLEVLAEETRDGVALRVLYNTDLFDAGPIRRLLGHFAQLLESILDEPACAVGDLRMLTTADSAEMDRWNATAVPYPRDSTIGQQFDRQVALTPDAPALAHEDERLSYREVQRWSNLLAHELRDAGVHRGDRVGICMDRSLEMVIGILAILKAGAAYVPLDPGYPLSRLALVLTDASCSLVLGRGPTSQALHNAGHRVLTMPSRPDAADPGPPVPDGINGEDCAYVMYTSGSTGQPKGIEVLHRNVIRLVCGTSYADLGPGQTVLQFAPLAFDASTFEIWGPLLNGGCLAVCPPHLPSLSQLGEVAQRHGVTTLWLTAGLFVQMVEHNVADLSSLQQLLTGGDVVSVPHVQRLLSVAPHCRLIDGYGPTETTTFACCYVVPRDEELPPTLPIGLPIANTTIHILDGRMQRVPVGVAGELYIGGDGVARGYVNDPALTAQRFLPDPFAPFGGVMYRTGDMARYRDDGVIEFLGRIDRQVKLRGFRIEPAEIEAALAGHPDIAEAAVVVSDDTGERRLVAHVVRGRAVTAQELRAHLQELLPPHMVPADFAFQENLPLTASGKVDRKALPGAPAPEVLGVEAENFTQRLLATLWADILGVEHVGVTDDFFDLGGHSLLAVRLFARIEQELGVRVPISAFLEDATIAHLSEVVTEAARAEMRPGAVKVKDGSGQPFFFFHAELDGTGFYSRTLAHHLAPDVPVFAVPPPGSDGGPIPLTAEAMHSSMVAAVRAVAPRGPYLLGGFCLGAFFAFEVAHRLRREGEEVSLLVLMHPREPGEQRYDRYTVRALDAVSDAVRLAEERRVRLYVLWRLAERYCLQPTHDWLDALRADWAARVGTGARGTIAQRALAALGRRLGLSQRRQLDLYLLALQASGHVKRRSVPRVIGPRRALTAWRLVVTPTLRGTFTGLSHLIEPAWLHRWGSRHYRPAFYEDRATLLVGADDDCPSVWRARIQDLDVRIVPGNHNSFVQHLPAIAETLQEYLDRQRPGMRSEESDTGGS